MMAVPTFQINMGPLQSNQFYAIFSELFTFTRAPDSCCCLFPPLPEKLYAHEWTWKIKKTTQIHAPVLSAKVFENTLVVVKGLCCFSSFQREPYFSLFVFMFSAGWLVQTTTSSVMGCMFLKSSWRTPNLSGWMWWKSILSKQVTGHH